MASLAQPIPQDSYGKGPNLSGGAIAGITIGTVIGTFGLIFGLIFLCAFMSLRHHRQQSGSSETPGGPMQDTTA